MTKEQAKILIDQLGGPNKLKAMIGVTHFFNGDQGVSFNFKGSKKHNSCTINLTSMDTYDMKISKFISGRESEIVEYNDIFCDQLKPLFTKTTGLELSL